MSTCLLPNLHRILPSAQSTQWATACCPGRTLCRPLGDTTAHPQDAQAGTFREISWVQLKDTFVQSFTGAPAVSCSQSINQMS